MAVGDVLSGNKGKAFKKPSTGSNVELEILGWTFDTEVGTERYGTSKSGGYDVSEPQNSRASGNVTAKRINDSTERLENVVTIGDQFDLLLEFDARSSSDADGVQVPCTIKKVAYAAKPETGEIQAVQFDYESNGAWSWYNASARPANA